jgi:hypothetical protein
MFDLYFLLTNKLDMREFFTEDNNRLSMKRLVGFICAVALALKLLHTPNETIIIAVASLAGASLGYTSIEKVFKKKE